MNVLQEFAWREMLHDATEGAEQAFATGSLKAYIGFDPSASSLHVGSLLPIMGLLHLQRAGHTPVALVGGGTGLIGDPSGKAEERQLLSAEAVAYNQEGIRGQLESFLDFESKKNPAVMVNNLEWLGETRILDFLRDVGKHFSVNSLLRKEGVRRRLENEETGISYTEFSYILLQSYDFLALYDRMGCTAQLGGSDQWGNITSGIDLIRRVRGAKAWGAVFPLITGAGGVKFGKTEEGAVWLDPERTSPFRFYQFWLNTDDRDVVRYLKFFTLFDRTAIEELEREVESDPAGRSAQRALAEDVTLRVHGESGVARARLASRVLFGGDVEGLGAREIEDIFSDVPSSELPADALSGEGMRLLELLAGSGVASSIGDARRSVEGGGIYLNNRRLTDAGGAVSLDDTIEGRYLLIRKGKRNYHLVRVR